MVLQNIQRVQFAPVEELPVAVAEIDPLAAPEAGRWRSPAYRPRRAGDRDRPRRALPPAGARGADPRAARRPDRRARPGHGRPARPAVGLGRRGGRRPAEVPAALVGDGDPRGWSPAAVAAEAPAAPVTVVAERAAWIRVYQENGTVLFESILESGQSYTPPGGHRRAADLGRQLRLGLRARSATRSTARSAAAPAPPRTSRSSRRRSPSASRWSTEVPEVISQSFGVAPAAPEPAVAIQCRRRRPGVTQRAGRSPMAAALYGQPSYCADRDARKR